MDELRIHFVTVERRLYLPVALPYSRKQRTQHPTLRPGSDRTSDAPPLMQKLRLIIGGSYGRLKWRDSNKTFNDGLTVP